MTCLRELHFRSATGAIEEQGDPDEPDVLGNSKNSVVFKAIHNFDFKKLWIAAHSDFARLVRLIDTEDEADIPDIREILAKAFEKRFLRIFKMFAYIRNSLHLAYIYISYSALRKKGDKVSQCEKQSTKKGLSEELSFSDVWFKHKYPSDSGNQESVNYFCICNCFIIDFFPALLNVS